MDYKNSDLPWCGNCACGKKDGGDIYCEQTEGWRLEDDFCGLHQWEKNEKS